MMGLGGLADQLKAEQPEGFEVWPDNLPVTDAWMVVCTQWNTVGLPTGQVLWVGLDYGGVKVGLDNAGVSLSTEEWSRLRMMERVASAVLNGNRS